MSIKEVKSLAGRRLLVAATGSIAAIKTPLLVSGLIKSGAEVRCIITPSASKFVSPLSLATLSRNRCYQDEDQWNPREARPLHIELAEWAEIIVIAPLSATSLGKWVNGLGDGLLASVLLASERPVLAVPAMNTGMWENNAVKRNWELLKQDTRVLSLAPSEGLLACDRLGDGRMMNADLIQLAIESTLFNRRKNGHLKKDLIGLRFLVTAGPTVETLDPARQITNKSSGKMGVFLAQAAKFRGAEVDLIHGPLQLEQSLIEGLNTFPITTAAEMEDNLMNLNKTADFIVMAAAISDFRIKASPSIQKIDKKNFLTTLSQSLELVPDLLSQLTAQRDPNQFILGFAALTGEENEIKKAGELKLVTKNCDLLLANPIDRSEQGFGSDFNSGFLLGPNGVVANFPVLSKLSLANKLLDELFNMKSKTS
tara:strand:+ start:3849 stop:5126 length:1278 start_codon:yes stop_codon:yes gene_type:complete